MQWMQQLKKHATQCYQAVHVMQNTMEIYKAGKTEEQKASVAYKSRMPSRH